jgi:hypothetical protein
MRGDLYFDYGIVPTARIPFPSHKMPLQSKGRSMGFHDRKQLRGELIQLIEKQIETIAKNTCEGLTAIELADFGNREKRINELQDMIRSLNAAA